MTEFNKEEIAEAFCEMMRERIPDLNDPPEQVCSERFEKRMQKLMKKETAQPWMRSHTGVRNALIAGLIVIILVLVAVPTGLSATKKPPFKVVPKAKVDVIYFEKTGTLKLEHVYTITALPEGFYYDEENTYINDEHTIISYHCNDDRQYIVLCQHMLRWKESISVDNEKLSSEIIEIDNTPVYFASAEDDYYLAWVLDGYEFTLSLVVEGIQRDEVIEMFRSIK